MFQFNEEVIAWMYNHTHTHTHTQKKPCSFKYCKKRKEKLKKSDIKTLKRLKYIKQNNTHHNRKI